MEKAPTETYADVGGLEQQIQEIKEAVELPLTHPELYEDIGIKPPKVRLWTGADFAPSPLAKLTRVVVLSLDVVATPAHFIGCIWVSRRILNFTASREVGVPAGSVQNRLHARQGVILYGEPGTGKTLLAKAVANQTSATFLRVVGSELIQKYLGDGPRLVRELFRVADDLSPTIVFIGALLRVKTRVRVRGRELSCMVDDLSPTIDFVSVLDHSCPASVFFVHGPPRFPSGPDLECAICELLHRRQVRVRVRANPRPDEALSRQSLHQYIMLTRT